jgi:hypothetical protein
VFIFSLNSSGGVMVLKLYFSINQVKLSLLKIDFLPAFFAQE